MHPNLPAAFHRWFHDEAGATAIEYALLAAMVAIAAISSLLFFSESLSTKFSEVAGAVSAAGE